jgi:hypothetical protein
MIKSYQQIVADLKDKLRSRLQGADVTDGSVIKELLDAYANELSALYSEVLNNQNLQSVRTVSGSDLDALASNYSMQRKQAQTAGCVVLLTRSLLSPNENIVVRSGSLIYTASNSILTGAPISFMLASDVIINGVNAEIYRATANQYRSFLDANGIYDIYAIAATAIAVNPGAASNVAKGALRKHSMPGVNNVINFEAASGGADLESDDDFRKRLLLVFAGSNLTTTFGLKSFFMSQNSVSDVAIIGPGHPLMVRDGTVSNGETVLVPGSGGMLDVYVVGQELEIGEENFIFSPNAGVDITDSSNDYILGRSSYIDKFTGILRELDASNRKLLASDPQLHVQAPITSLISVVGTQSGPLDNGVNYELIRDIDSDSPSAFANSSFGFDRIHWLQNHKSIVGEDIMRVRGSSYDFTQYTDLLSIDDIHAQITINQEVAVVSPTIVNQDTTLMATVYTRHAPVFSVSAVENYETGERYNIESYDSSGTIKISGRSLPTTDTIVLVSYTWDKYFDPSFDYSLIDNMIYWVSASTPLLQVSQDNIINGVVFSDVVNSNVITSHITVPHEVAVTVSARGTGKRTVIVQGTSITTVINQYQRVSSDIPLDSTGTFYVFRVIAPTDASGVIGGTYARDIVTSYETLAQRGSPVGRVYPENNPLGLNGTFVTPNVVAMYNNATIKESKIVSYVTTNDGLQLLIPISEITKPKLGDDIYLSFLWEVPHPVSSTSNTIRKADPSGTIRTYYVLGADEGLTDDVVRNVNNPAYVNPNSGLANIGNYDRLVFAGAISGGNNTQYTYKRFATIDSILVSTDNNSLFTNISVSLVSSPEPASHYKIDYTYTAPKAGERIVATYFYNKTIGSLTKTIESERIINTDILVKAAIEVPLSVAVSVVATSGTNPVTMQSTVGNALLAIMNTNSLSGSLQPSYVTSELFRLVPGLINVNFTRFSRKTEDGVKEILLKDNEYYSLDISDVAVVVAIGRETVGTDYFTEGSTSPILQPTGLPSTCESARKVIYNPKECSPR